MSVPKKIIALLLSLPLLFFALGPAFAAGTALPVPQGAIPEGCRLTGLSRTDDAGKIWYYAETAPSKYGLTNFVWLDSTGRLASPAEMPGVAYFPASVPEGGFPAAYDAREEGLVSPVEKQIGGTCWAHAAAAVMEACAVKNGFYPSGGINVSEYHIVWNTYHGYEEGVTDSRNDGEKPYAYVDILERGGNCYSVGRAVLNGEGPADERRYALDEELNKTDFEQEMASTFDFTNRYDRDLAVTAIHTFDSTVEGVKTAVLTYGAAQISYYAAVEGEVYDNVKVHEADYYNFEWGKEGETRPCAYFFPYGFGTNHAVTVVGWDDGFSRENFNEKNRPAHDGAFLVKNSWGTDFGNDGFFWLSYDDPNLYGVAAYEVAPAEDYEILHSHTGYGTDKTFSGSNQATKCRAAANVFTAERDELLTAVSGGWETAGRLAVAVYGDLPESVTDPTAGTLLFSGTLQGNGSIWIPLETPVAISAGMRFSVVFTDVSAIGVEGDGTQSGSSSGYVLRFTSHPGESFVLLNEKWKDLNTINLTSYKPNNAAISVAARLAPSAPRRVTFTCPGHYTFTVPADENGNVALPETEGHTWVITDKGAPFTGTGVTGDVTVTAHCYPNGGEPSSDSSCVTLYRCVYCGKEIRERIEDHDWQWVTDEEPTCVNGGTKHEECLNCGMKRGESVYLEPTGEHRWYWYIITEPTCGRNGYKMELCAVCGQQKEDQFTVIPATGEHDWQWIIDYAPTCGRNGCKYRQCDVCGTTADENTVIPATGEHDWQWHIDVEPTCGTDGYKYRQCGVCGTLADENTVIPATGEHDWQWIVDAEPTCGTDGCKHRQCDVCGTTADENTVIPATGEHDWQWIVDAEPQGCIPGLQHRYCPICGQSDSLNTPVPGGDHAWGWVTVLAPGCTTPGEKYEECARCGARRNEATPIAPAGHVLSGWIVDPAPTATSDGERYVSCTVCGEILQRERIPMTGPAGIRRGDVDFDGSISAADARLALRRAVALEDYAEGSAQFLACDADGNNAVTAADARLILRAAVGLEDPAAW